MPENQLVSDIYQPKSGKGFKRWLIVIALFFITFLFTFPFNRTITTAVENAIFAQRACPISYSEMKLTWFAPGLTFENPVIGGACFQKPGSDLALSAMRVSLAGPNFSPLGVRFKVLATSESSQLEAYPAIGIGQQLVRITNTTIGEDILNTFTGMNLLVGTIKVDGLIELAQNQVSSAKFKLESQNLSTNVANIAGFMLPKLNLGAFILTAELDAAGKLLIDKLSLGSNDSTLAANFKGSLALNRYNILFSNADLAGEVRFSEDFFQAIPLVKLLLQGKQATDGFYRLEIKGPLGQTRPNFL